MVFARLFGDPHHKDPHAKHDHQAMMRLAAEHLSYRELSSLPLDVSMPVSDDYEPERFKIVRQDGQLVVVVYCDMLQLGYLTHEQIVAYRERLRAQRQRDPNYQREIDGFRNE